jgi:hypothetical protein
MLLVSCGGNDDDEPNDDLCKVGVDPAMHGGSGADCPWTFAEGGDIRMWKIELDPEPGMEPGFISGGYGFFFKDQSTPIRPQFGPKIGTDYCFDLRAGTYFDNGISPYQLDLVNSRTYLDVGAEITLTNGQHTYNLPPKMDEIDPLVFLRHDRIYISDIPPEEIASGGHFDVHVPNVTIGKGITPDGRPIETPWVNLPGNVDVDWGTLEVSPDEMDIRGLKHLDTTQDFTVTWTQPATDEERSYFTFVTWADPESDYISPFMCLNTRNEGTMTIPKEVLALLPDHGDLVWGMTEHHAHSYDGRRLDILGMECHAALYEIP